LNFVAQPILAVLYSDNFSFNTNKGYGNSADQFGIGIGHGLLSAKSSSLASGGCFYFSDLEAVWVTASRCKKHSQDWLCYKILMAKHGCGGEKRQERGYERRKKQEHSQDWLCHKTL